MRSLTDYSGYALSTIERVIGPSLVREGGQKDATLRGRIKNAIKAGKRNGKPVERAKRAACIASDVAKIVAATPDYVPTKAEEASLWLFSLETGARAISATSVLIGDLQWQGDYLRVKLRVTKGNDNWNHHVQLDAAPHQEARELDFFHWLRAHLISRGLDLHNLDKTRASEKLWHWSAEAARELFRGRVRDAGFRPGMFSYHSLRAGFLCSALLKANTPE
jgi:hypothetical protein